MPGLRRLHSGASAGCLQLQDGGDGTGGAME